MKVMIKRIIATIAIVYLFLSVTVNIYNSFVYRQKMEELASRFTINDTQTVENIEIEELLDAKELIGEAHILEMNTATLLVSTIIGLIYGLILSLKENTKIKYILFFILFNVIFNMIWMICDIKEMNIKFVELYRLYVESFFKTLILYSICYILAITIGVLLKKIKVRKLNEELKTKQK